MRYQRFGEEEQVVNRMVNTKQSHFDANMNETGSERLTTQRIHALGSLFLLIVAQDCQT